MLDPPISAGGFLSPAPTSPATSTTSSSTIFRPLPHQSSRPLKAGSRSEVALISYLDGALLEVSRKHHLRSSPGGYAALSALCEDLEKLVDVLWISSTPGLQIQYLLQVANSVGDYMMGGYGNKQIEWQALLGLLGKLDRCFYALITGSSSEEDGGVSLSGRMNMTEKVRLKSVVERTRLDVVKLAEFENVGGGGAVEPVDVPTESVRDIGEPKVEEWMRQGEGGAGTVMDVDETGDEGGEDRDLEWETEVSRVYERVLQEIGDELAEATPSV